MGGSPVWILERTRDTRDVELVQKLLVSFTLGRRWNHSRFWSWSLIDRQSVGEGQGNKRFGSGIGIGRMGGMGTGNEVVVEREETKYTIE